MEKIISLLENLISFINKRWKIVLFAVFYICLLFLKFKGLLAIKEILPGGDTLAHFYSFKEFVSVFKEGGLFTYLPQWFGGEPLFSFYPPFIFMLMAFFHVLSGIDITLVFRLFVFLSFAVFPIPFYFFLKEFFDKKMAKFGVWLSLFWVFYPKLMGSIGAGAGASVFYGLFSQAISVSFLLWYLVLLHKIIVKRKKDFKWFFWAVISLSLIIVSHIVTFIAAFVCTVLFVVYYWCNFSKKNVLKRVLLIGLISLLISSFWLLPFLSNFKYSSGERVDFKGYVQSPLIPFLQFNLSNLFNGRFLDFYYGLFFIFILFIAGFWFLIKKRRFFILFLLGVFFFVFNLEYLPQVLLLKLPLHYYRFLTYQLVFYLAIGAFGFYNLFFKLKKKNILWPSLLIGLMIFSILHLGIFYNLGNGTSSFDNKPRISGVESDIPYFWKSSSFSFFSSGKKVVNYLNYADLPEEPTRIMSDLNIMFMVKNLGSIHFFNTFVPLINNQSVISGLYAESSWQVPFIFPVTNNISGNNIKWGRVRDLYFNPYFQSQNIQTMVDRMRLFGMNYIIMATDYLEPYKDYLKGVEMIKEFPPFKIYHIKDADPIIYEVKNKPGLYINVDNSISFRRFALGWYSQPNLLSYPVAGWDTSPFSLKEKVVEDFDYLIIGLSEKNPEVIDYLNKFDKPMLILNKNSSSIFADDDVKEIVNFNPAVSYYKSRRLLANVEGLRQMEEFIIKNASRNKNIDSIEKYSIKNEEIHFSNIGPTIINLGYFPYWKGKANNYHVYPVTPGQMLVFADGDVDLKYESGRYAKYGKWISLVTLFGFLLFSVFRFYKNKNNVE